jgi:glycosyltransferase involved in cell wall biosynthesis
MKLTKKVLGKYNSQDSLLVISVYPKKGEIYSKGVTGVASYAKNTAINMKRSIVVLADYSNQPTTYEERNTLVHRSFKTNSPFMWLQLLRAVFKFNNIKNILFQYDFAMYGGMITTGFMPAFGELLKLLGYKMYVVNHHVVSDVNNLSGHMGLTTSIVDRIKTVAYNVIFHTFYKVLGYCSHKIIVLEEPLKLRLAHYVPTDQIITIPHAVDTSIKGITKEAARKKLGINEKDYIVMFFGFVNWFKGADFFARAASNITKLFGKKVHFILAGGESITLKDKEYYQRYFKKVQNTVKLSKGVTLTGYVPQNMIPVYFSAADVVTFPYREFMCASGVLSLVFSNKRPFIVSDRLKGMFEAPDFKQGLKQVKLDKNDLVFSLNQKAFHKQVAHILHNGLKKKTIDLAEYMRNERSFKKNAQLYDYVIFHPVYSMNPQALFKYTPANGS